ncbi:MAG: hypothetical protein HUK25_04040 [Treponema sp.]|nr:hypothetical protein [Treponema sp.]
MENLAITRTIENKLNTSRANYVFSAIDYSDLAELNTLHQIFSRFEKEGKIRRIIQGIYYIPRYSSLLQEYEEPSPTEIANALARKNRWQIIPEGNAALNQLGLSTQVPAKWTFISSGPYSSFEYKNIKINFKRGSPKHLSSEMSYKTALIIQAIKTLGKDRITDADIRKISNRLSEEEKERILTESRYTTSWIYSCIKKICNYGKAA